MRRSTLVLVAAGALLAGCPSYTHLPDAEQALVNRKVTGQSRQLTVSMYVGPFFRDANNRLLEDQPPASVDLLRGPGGARIAPGKPTGILPAGTRVVIQDVQFPTAEAATSRALMTPRYFTWVILRHVGTPKPLVLVLRDDPTTHQAFLSLLGRYLTTADVAAKVAGFPEDVREAIGHKQMREGLTTEQARMAWGLPLKVRRDRVGQRVTETWTYEGGRTVTLKGGKVTAFAEAKTPVKDASPAPVAGSKGD